jgi:hypothetical protein
MFYPDSQKTTGLPVDEWAAGFGIPPAQAGWKPVVSLGTTRLRVGLHKCRSPSRNIGKKLAHAFRFFSHDNENNVGRCVKRYSIFSLIKTGSN